MAVVRAVGCWCAAASLAGAWCAAPLTAQIVTIATVEVGNPGNAPDPIVMDDGSSGFGGVAYVYQCGTIEVTNAQYAAFLNAVADSDPNGLYHASMNSAFNGGIVQTGSDGSFTYQPKPGFGDKPVNFASFFDAARFANWLHNGQPTGPQGPGTTETGAYTMLGPASMGPGDLDGNGRNSGWLWAVPSEDEWHKAAYGSPGNLWTLYATGSDTAPTATSPPGTPNSANYNGAVPLLTNGGAYGPSPSPWGTFDQNGNLREVNEGGKGVRRVRGGSWDTPANALRSSDRGATDNGTFVSSDAGFRVVRLVAPVPLGACCLPGGDCVDAGTEDDCAALGGTYAGDRTLCDACPATGACCLTDGACLDGLTATECGSSNGIFLGDDSACAASTCKAIEPVTLLGITFTGDAYLITAPDGAGTLLGPTGWTQLNSMARDSEGSFVTATAVSPQRLLKVDPLTGLATELTTPFLDDIRALAFAPDGTLYAADHGTNLYALDLSLPPGDPDITTLIGPFTDGGGMQGMTFSPDGTLYGWSTVLGLVTIDPSSAAVTDVNGFTDGTSEIQTLSFGLDGTLFGAHDVLHVIDTGSGVATPLASTGFSGIRGVETIAAPCPADLDDNRTVGIGDLLALLASWGSDPGGPPDLDGDGNVGISDLLILLASWGPCT